MLVVKGSHMKKFLLFITLLAFTFLSVNTLVHATEARSETAFFFPSDELYIVNGELPDPSFYSSNHYVPLTPVTNFGFDVVDMINHLQSYYELRPFISSMRLRLLIEVYNPTAVNGDFISSDSHVVSVNPYLPDTSTSEFYALNYEFDLEHGLPNEITFTSIYTDIFLGGTLPYYGVDSIRLKSVSLEVNYLISLSTVTDLVDDYDLLPDTLGDYVPIVAIDLYDHLDRVYRFYIEDGDDYLSFDVVIPEEIDVLSDSFIASQFSLFTNDDGDQLLVYQPDLNLLPLVSEENVSFGLTIMDLTLSHFVSVGVLELNAIPFVASNWIAELYMFFDFPIDDLLSIEVFYDYRYRSILFPTTQWYTAHNVYTYGERTEIDPPFWYLTGFAIPYLIADLTNSFNQDTIQNIDSFDIPAEVTYTYTHTLGGSIFDYQSLGLFKVVLGQYNELNILYNGLDISEVVVMRILYSYDGVLLDVPFEMIEQVNPDFDSGVINIPDVLSEASSTLIIIIGIASLLLVGVVGLKVFSRFKKRQKQDKRYKKYR